MQYSFDSSVEQGGPVEESSRLNAEEITLGSHQASFDSEAEDRAYQQAQAGGQASTRAGYGYESGARGGAGGTYSSTTSTNRIASGSTAPTSFFQSHAASYPTLDQVGQSQQHQGEQSSYAVPDESSELSNLNRNNNNLDFSEGNSSSLNNTQLELQMRREQNGIEDSLLSEQEVKVEIPPPPAKKKAGPEGGAGQHLTLREQEKVIDVIKKENFSLKLKIYFLEERLASLTPEQVDAALQEGIEFKVEFQTVKQELKRYKKLLLEAERVLLSTGRERDSALNNYNAASIGAGKVGGRERELEDLLKKNYDAAERERHTLEDQLRAQGAELAALRDRQRKQADEHMEENSRAEITRLREEIDAERDAREDLLDERNSLKASYDEAQDRLDEALEEVDQLRLAADTIPEEDEDVSAVSAGETRKGRTQREVERLATVVDELEKDIEHLQTEATAREADVETLEDKLAAFAQDVEELENANEQLEMQVATLNDRDNVEEGGMTREELLAEFNIARDKCATLALSLESREGELEEALAELELLGTQAEEVLEERVAEVREEWRSEVDVLNANAETRDAEIDQLVGRVEELEAAQLEYENEVTELETRLLEQEEEMKRVEAENKDMNSDLNKLASEIVEIEAEETENAAKFQEAQEQLESLRRELEDKTALHDQMTAALKEKLVSTKRTLEEELDQIHDALRKTEEEREVETLEYTRQRRSDEARWQSIVDSKDKIVQSTSNELSSTQTRLKTRETDLQSLQAALNGLRSESTRLGESHSHDRYAMEVELEKTTRALSACEEELEQLRVESARRGAALDEAEAELINANAEVRDTSNLLAEQTQTRLALSDKFDQTTKRLRNSESDLSAARDRLLVLEDQVNSKNKTLTRTESQLKDQLTERNTLLLTVYQNLDKLVGSGDKAPRRVGAVEPKPFTNFVVFHETMMGKLKSVNGLSVTFDKRTREIEIRFADQFSSLKKQQETRLRQLDRVETSVKAATESQRQWRQRVIIKQTELDAAKVTNQELQSQLAALRSATPVSGSGSPTASSAKLATLSTRASTAERHLLATQAQLAKAETKLDEARAKVSVAEGKWEARLRELESRLRASDEKVKRERQGAKERVAELGETIKSLEGQVKGAGRRNVQVEQVIHSSSHRAE